MTYVAQVGENKKRAMVFLTMLCVSAPGAMYWKGKSQVDIWHMPFLLKVAIIDYRLLFPSGVGGEQKQSEKTVNVGLAFTRWWIST